MPDDYELTLSNIKRLVLQCERGSKHKLPRRKIIQNVIWDLQAEALVPYRDPNREHSTHSRGIGL